MMIVIPCTSKNLGRIAISFQNETSTSNKHDLFSTLFFEIQFTKLYPKEKPFFHLYYKGFEEFQDLDLIKLSKLISEKSEELLLMKRPFIFDLCLILEEEFSKMKNRITFHDNMIKAREISHSGYFYIFFHFLIIHYYIFAFEFFFIIVDLTIFTLKIGGFYAFFH